jgi:hypothetical protein
MRDTATPSAAPRRRRLGRGRAADGFLGPAVLVGLVVCGVLATSLIDGGDERRSASIASRAIALSGEPTAIAAAGGRLWILDGRSRRLRSLTGSAPASAGRLVTTGRRTVGTDVAPDGDGVWVAVARSGSGGGRVVRFGPSGRDRVLATASVAPRRIAVLPGAVLALGSARLASIRRDGRGAWTRSVPDAVDVAVGYRSVWTVSRTSGGSLVRRWTTSGRPAGIRRVPGAVTAIAVGHGAVWLANGCPGSVARAPVGPGPVTCRRIGSGFSDVAIGVAAVWAADDDGDRVVRLVPLTGAVAASARLPGGPAGVVADGDRAWTLTRRAGVFLLEVPRDPRAA